jgi:4-hydroxy-3-methylbut-2-enyl diphosphate reductase
MKLASKEPLKVRMASPRGFCAGVERAIRAVEDALAAFGAPVYVRHEIVHNRHVVERLAAMGAIFVEDIADAKDDRPVIISAHGAPAAVHQNAEARGLTAIDATCPLVHKVHAQARRHVAKARHVYLIGHEGHPEVVGTMGQVRAGAVTLVETPEEVDLLPDREEEKAYVTQTTLSVEDAQHVIDALQRRFPDIIAPQKQDICYATTNRQEAVKASAPGVDLYLVFGSPTSSNSLRLVETARRAGAKEARLIEDADAFEFSQADDLSLIGISSGASAPEELIEEFLKKLAEKRALVIDTVETAREDVVFNSPMKLAG